MSARTDLVDVLTPLLPGWRIVGYADLPDSISRPTVCLWQDALNRRDGMTGSYSLSLEIWVLSQFESNQKAEDQLDDLLETFLPALQQVQFVEFETAQRGVLDQAFHGYNITATIPYITIGA